MNEKLIRNIIRIVITVMLALFLTGVAVGSVNPTLAGSYDTAGGVKDVAVSGSYAYVADSSNGLVIIDISNPAVPTLAGSYNTAGYAQDVAVSGNYAYVSKTIGYDDVFDIVDISNPAAPTLAGSYDALGFNPGGVTVSGSYAYVADYDNGLVIIDISNPATPTLTGSYDTEGLVMNVAVSSGYAYIADSSNGLVIVDISNPEAPTLAGSYDALGFNPGGVAVSGGYAYIADSSNGLIILNIDAPDKGIPSALLSNTENTATMTEEDNGDDTLDIFLLGKLLINQSDLIGDVDDSTIDIIQITITNEDNNYFIKIKFVDNIDVNARYSLVFSNKQKSIYDIVIKDGVGGIYKGQEEDDGSVTFYATDSDYIKDVKIQMKDNELLIEADFSGLDFADEIHPSWLSVLRQGNNHDYSEDSVSLKFQSTDQKSEDMTSPSIVKYDYSWFENNADLRIQATDLLIMNLEPYNGTASDYFTNLNKDIRDQVLFPILLQFGEVFIPIPFDYELLNPTSVNELNANTVTKLTSKGVLSSSEIATVASYDLDALSMLSWYNKATNNIQLTGYGDSGQSATYPLNSLSLISDLKYYRQLLIQERNYWATANNAETTEDQEQAISNAVNIIDQEKTMVGIKRFELKEEHNLYSHIQNVGFYTRARTVEGKPRDTANLFVEYIQTQQDYVDDFDVNNVNIVASSLSNKDDTKITYEQEPTLNQQHNQEKTSVTTMLKDKVNKIFGWFESIF